MMRHICLLGLGPTYPLAPWDDPTVERWSFASAKYSHENAKVARWFELHDPWMVRDHEDRDFFRWAGALTTPIFMQRRYPEIPASVAFPRAPVIEKRGRPYFTSTIAWMAGLAWLEGVDRLSLYGIDLSSASEYAFERPCLEGLLERMEADGVTLDIPAGSFLFKADRFYGWNDPTPAAPIFQPYRIGNDRIRVNGVQIAGVYAW